MAALTGVLPAGPEKADLLQIRMNALGLDVSAWRRFRPAMLAELRNACEGCGCRAMCAHDLQRLGGNPASRAWREYCPVSSELDTIVALQFY
jgi:hypothetical protein